MGAGHRGRLWAATGVAKPDAAWVNDHGLSDFARRLEPTDPDRQQEDASS